MPISRSLVLLCLSLSVVACSRYSIQAHDAPEGSATTLVVYRPHYISGANAPVVIAVDGVDIALLRNNTYLETPIRGQSCRLGEVVEMHESPATVARKKRDSSIWVATELVKSGEADAVVSPGNTGASMVASFFVLGLIKGVERPAIATMLPTLTGSAVMLDVGANVDCTAQHLEQFALMGNEFAKHVYAKQNPRVGLLSIGEEDSKGNEVTKEAFKLLKASSLNFIGNVEGREVYSGTADVVVCDGFIGNVAIRPGTAAIVLGKRSNLTG